MAFDSKYALTQAIKYLTETAKSKKAHGGAVERHGYSVDGGVPEAGNTGSAAGNSYGGDSGYSGASNSDNSPSESGPGPGMGGGNGNNGGSGNGSDSGFGGDNGNAGQDYLGNMMNQSAPFGGAEIMSPFSGTQMGIPSQSQQHMLDQLGVEGSPYAGGLPKSAALGSNIGSDMLKQTMSSGFDLSGIAKQPGFGDSPNLPGSDLGKSQTIGGSLGAAQTEALRSGSGWSSEYDPKGISKGVEMGAQMATPSSGMLGQPPMGTTTFGQMPLQSGSFVGGTKPQDLTELMGTAPINNPLYAGMNVSQAPVPGTYSVNPEAALTAINKYAPIMTKGWTTDQAMTAVGQNLPENATLSGTTLKSPASLSELNAKLQSTVGDNIPVSGILNPVMQTNAENAGWGTSTVGSPINVSGGVEPQGMGDLYGASAASEPTQFSQPNRPATPTPDTAYSQPSVGSGSPVESYNQAAPISSARQNFNKAFAEARSSGQDTFTWTNPATGKTSLYTTQLARKEGGRVPSMANPDDWLAHIKVDTPKGKKREHHGSKPLPVDYGHIAGTVGADDMDVDAFIGPNKSSAKAFIINQYHPESKKFDEHKIMLGFDNKAQAMNAYRKSYPEGLADRMAKSIISAPAKETIEWAKSGKTSQPVDKNTIVQRALMLSSRKS